MCDTLVALANSTTDGSVLFAKNSDREPNEAQTLELIPAQDYAAGSRLKCTYLEIPQAIHTHQVLLSRPFWMWGAEMGSNELGVTIGNEAVFTRLPYEKGPALTGMDLLRLGLERAASAADALKVITSLLETHGQGGNCGYQHPFYYHNSFLIADPAEAWVLETAGRQWAAQKVQDVRSISNGLTIESDWDLASDRLVETAVEHGWCKSRDDFSFRRCYSDPLYTRLSASASRQVCTLNGLTLAKGKIDPAVLIDLLGSHTRDSQPGWSPDKGLMGADVCMHAGYGPIRTSQSVASMVSHLKPGASMHWQTGTSAPCTGLFKPLWMDAGLPDTGPTPQGIYDPATLFWRHELLHRQVLRNYPARKAAYHPDQQALQSRWLAEASLKSASSAPSRLEFSRCCFAEEITAEKEWLERIAQIPDVRQPLYTRLAWNQFNREAGMLPQKKGE